MTTKKCEREDCGALFTPRKGQSELGRGRYCCMSCYHATRGHEMTETIAVRVTQQQARLVRDMGGAKFLRDLIQERLTASPAVRLESVWRTPV